MCSVVFHQLLELWLKIQFPRVFIGWIFFFFFFMNHCVLRTNRLFKFLDRAQPSLISHWRDICVIEGINRQIKMVASGGDIDESKIKS